MSNGVSTRRVDELVQAMGMSGISKSSVSKLCKDIDERANAFLKRPLHCEWLHLWLDATYLKVREGLRSAAASSTSQITPASTLARLLVVDADYFKGINDRYRHSNGDVALKLIA